MAKHHPDLIFCRKQAGVAIGRLCEKCDGKCVICDSYVRPCTLVRICDECNYGSYQGRCVICGGPGVSDAYYCKECTIQEKDAYSQKPASSDAHILTSSQHWWNLGTTTRPTGDV
ncbi:PHD finger-like domain-containing protein 5A isoform X3 [Physeter macrocephalus]|uniref:PHD finger-like domain-containing protein 5A isoform X3 n=1 Tax=Physeter macrocephalus TaxID=9755 RepID=A0A455BRH6_PHYMC|nr:PHD finger-like domain-containing protein 5A isoform X3 [Physeter catodon]XP_058937108.1 PHD finger-like domain-containing protein 5A isoform X1 [Kogia breviceps]|eukprot:XP_028346481.1 PHD finger-like domain-containing protein 5A isoform X2 [Physeter catodon]